MAVLHYAEMVAQDIQSDFTGYHKLLLRRRVNSRLFASAALAARTQGSPEFLRYIVRSLVSWPFPDLRPARYKIFLKMLFQKISGWRA
jgi:hypothetical protein